ncbi:lipocalin-like domain-containing protein [Marinicella sp. W31]|uniref:lipocalin-like domain-containing protein n=1 Tax=Marinicella sp. W31 TaxID=3023713 RepID=UPI0037578F30
MFNKNAWLLILFIPAFLAGCSTTSHHKNEAVPSIIGSWEMREVHWFSDEQTYSIEEAQPGLFIFEDQRYAIMWTALKEPRAAFEILAQPTPEEVIESFKSVVFNAGSYAINGAQITTTAYIAKVPGFEGGQQFYNYTIEEDILTLTMYDETYPNGEKPNWAGKVQTRFVMQRAK